MLCEGDTRQQLSTSIWSDKVVKSKLQRDLFLRPWALGCHDAGFFVLYLVQLQMNVTR